MGESDRVDAMYMEEAKRIIDELEKFTKESDHKVSFMTHDVKLPEQIQVDERVPSIMDKHFCQCNPGTSSFKPEKNHSFQLLIEGEIFAPYDPRLRKVIDSPLNWVIY